MIPAFALTLILTLTFWESQAQGFDFIPFCPHPAPQTLVAVAILLRLSSCCRGAPGISDLPFSSCRQCSVYLAFPPGNVNTESQGEVQGEDGQSSLKRGNGPLQELQLQANSRRSPQGKQKVPFITASIPSTSPPLLSLILFCWPPEEHNFPIFHWVFFLLAEMPTITKWKFGTYQV